MVDRMLMVDGEAVGSDATRLETYGHQNRWRTEVRADGSVVDVMPEKQEKFLVEWCMQWPRPMTQQAWADEHGISVRTVQNWLCNDRFKQVWRDRADESYASPAWTAPLVAETYRMALNEANRDGDRVLSPAEQLKAIEVFAKFVNMTTPTQIEHKLVPADQQLAQMSSADLAAAAGLQVATTETLLDEGVIDLDLEGL